MLHALATTNKTQEITIASAPETERKTHMARQPKLPPGMWKRGDTYYARFRANGRLVRKRLSTNLEAAKQLVNEFRARRSCGVWPDG